MVFGTCPSLDQAFRQILNLTAQHVCWPQQKVVQSAWRQLIQLGRQQQQQSETMVKINPAWYHIFLFFYLLSTQGTYFYFNTLIFCTVGGQGWKSYLDGLR